MPQDDVYQQHYPVPRLHNALARGSVGTDWRDGGDLCTGCGLCLEACPMQNITLNNSNAAEVGPSCLGCGICTHVCPQDAVHLRPIRAKDHIPA